MVKWKSPRDVDNDSVEAGAYLTLLFFKRLSATIIEMVGNFSGNIKYWNRVVWV